MITVMKIILIKIIETIKIKIIETIKKIKIIEIER